MTTQNSSTGHLISHIRSFLELFLSSSSTNPERHLMYQLQNTSRFTINPHSSSFHTANKHNSHFPLSTHIIKRRTCPRHHIAIRPSTKLAPSLCYQILMTPNSLLPAYSLRSTIHSSTESPWYEYHLSITNNGGKMEMLSLQGGQRTPNWAWTKNSFAVSQSLHQGEY